MDAALDLARDATFPRKAADADGAPPPPPDWPPSADHGDEKNSPVAGDELPLPDEKRCVGFIDSVVEFRYRVQSMSSVASSRLPSVGDISEASGSTSIGVGGAYNRSRAPSGYSHVRSASDSSCLGNGPGAIASTSIPYPAQSSSGPAKRTSDIGEWRATTTVDGRKYFYSVRTREVCWELPEGVQAPRSAGHQLRVGDQVEVFSNSAGLWCSGYVAKLAGDSVSVAFQLPGSSLAEWVTKELPVAHEHLRREDGVAIDVQRPAAHASCEGIGFQDTRLPSNWSPEEQERYEILFEEASHSGDDPDTPVVQRLAAYLNKSGLPRRALKEIWQVSNPEVKECLGRDEFWACCRLIGHSQAALEESSGPKLLEAGGAKLRAWLRGRERLGIPPLLLPNF